MHTSGRENRRQVAAELEPTRETGDLFKDPEGETPFRVHGFVFPR